MQTAVQQLKSTSVTENVSPSLSISGDLEYCQGFNTILTANGTGTYLWSESSTTESIVATSGDYTVTLTDANGCTATQSTSVTENVSPSLSISGDLEYCQGFNTILTANGTGTYLWSESSTTESIVATSGDYTVTLTDANGCTATQSTSVTENVSPSLSISGDLEYCQGFNTILTANGTGTYLWSESSTTESIVATSGDYTVTLN